MKIVIALDGSRLAEAALGPGVALARTAEAEVLLLNVFNPRVETGGAPGGTPAVRQAAVTAERRQYLERMAEGIQGVPVRVAVWQQQKSEDADECIARAVKDEAGDILVVASKQAARVTGLLLGSTAQGLLRLSPCPVLIVRPPDSI